MNIEAGQQYYLRLYGGTVVTATIRNKIWFMCLCEWSVGERWAHPEPYIWRQVVKWRPSWRLYR